MSIHAQLLDEVLAEAHEDYVGLWVVARRCSELGIRDPEERRRLVVEIAARLLDAGLSIGEFRDKRVEAMD